MTTFTLYHNDKLHSSFNSLSEAANEAYFMAVACHPSCDPKRHRMTPAPSHIFSVLDEYGRPRVRIDAATVREACPDFPMTPAKWVAHGWDL